MTQTNPKKIMLGISGGVDSAVSALLLQEQGFDVEAVFMQNWEAELDDPYCRASEDLSDARRVCDVLGIPLRTVNFAKDYWARVFQYFLDEYAAGRTPNPDVLCNKEIKFKAFLDFALGCGVEKIAMGHYAQVQQGEGGKWCLLKGGDAGKDQSYFLHLLSQYQLSHSVFPLGGLTKTAVRQIALDRGLPVHAKKDSTGICFIGERRFKDFLGEYLLAQPGDIETVDAQVIGRHDGLMFYTLGQRKGIGVGGRKNASEAPWFVVAKDIKRNVLIVGQGEHPLLFSQQLFCAQVHWISGETLTQGRDCWAKVRYRQADQACRVMPVGDDKYRVDFQEPQRAIAPGQSVVFYEGEICLGGGVIL